MGTTIAMVFYVYLRKRGASEPHWYQVDAQCGLPGGILNRLPIAGEVLHLQYGGQLRAGLSARCLEIVHDLPLTLDSAEAVVGPIVMVRWNLLRRLSVIGDHEELWGFPQADEAEYHLAILEAAGFVLNIDEDPCDESFTWLPPGT
jgi:hypothetical protein